MSVPIPVNIPVHVLVPIPVHVPEPIPVCVPVPVHVSVPVLTLVSMAILNLFVIFTGNKLNVSTCVCKPVYVYPCVLISIYHIKSDQLIYNMGYFLMPM